MSMAGKSAGPLDMVVIGGGAAGCAAAVRGAQLGLRVALAEMRDSGLGGTALHELGEACELLCDKSGAKQPDLRDRWNAAAEQTRSALRQQLLGAGVELLSARGFVAGEHEVAALAPDTGDELARLEARHIVLASGAGRQRVFGRGAEEAGLVELAELLSAGPLPEHCAVYGSGALACRSVSLLRAMGVQVKLILDAPELLGGEDEELSRFVVSQLVRGGCCVISGAQLVRAERVGDVCRLTAGREGGGEETLWSGQVVDARKRVPNSRHLGIGKLGIKSSPATGGVACDGALRTSVAHIHGVGECVSAGMAVSVAEAQGRFVAERIAGVGASIGEFDPRVVVRGISCAPAVAGVGWSETQACQAGREAVAGRAGFPGAEEGDTSEDVASSGFFKLVSDEQTGELLGASACGAWAHKAASLVAWAMESELTVAELAQGAYPGGQAAAIVARAARRVLAAKAAPRA